MNSVTKLCLLLLIGLPALLAAQISPSYPSPATPSITVNMPETSQHKDLAKSYAVAFEGMDISRKVRIEVQRGARSDVIEPVVGLRVSGSLLLLQVGTGSPNGRRQVVIRADDVVLMRENP